MNARAKYTVVALLASAVTAAGFLVSGPRWSSTPERIADGSDALVSRSAVPDAVPAPRSLELAAAPDLALTPEETAFVRRAVLEERRRINASRIRPEDSGLEILRRHLEEGADLGETLTHFEGFAGHVRSARGVVRKVTSEGEVTKVDLDQVAPGAGVIDFGPGVFRIERSTRRWLSHDDDLVELEIRGAGIDLTTLIATDPSVLSIDKRLENLRIHDLTFDGDGRGQLLDVRGGTSAILEAVRLKGWAIAGHAAPIGISGGAYVGCRRCEILGRQGTDRGGFGISLRGDSIAFFDGCLFSDVDAAIIGGSGAAAQSAARFENCTFENSCLADSRLFFKGKPEFPVSVRGGSVFVGAPGLSEERRRETWGAMYAREVDGVTFAAGVARCTVADLIRTLEAVRLEGEPRVVAIRRLGTARAGPPTSFRIFVADKPPQPSHIFRVEWKDGRVVAQPDDRGGGHRIPSSNLMESALPLVEVLRKLPPTTEVEEAYSESRPMGEGNAAIPVVWIEGPDRSRVATLDARTGAAIR